MQQKGSQKVLSCSVKKVFFKVSQNLRENACVKVFSLIKFYWKRDSEKDVFLWILQKNLRAPFL